MRIIKMTVTSSYVDCRLRPHKMHRLYLDKEDEIKPNGAFDSPLGLVTKVAMRPASARFQEADNLFQ